jgi:hypothetical protein
MTDLRAFHHFGGIPHYYRREVIVNEWQGLDVLQGFGFTGSVSCRERQGLLIHVFRLHVG